VIQNAAARLVNRARRPEHVTAIPCDLHWLLVRQRKTFVELSEVNALYQVPSSLLIFLPKSLGILDTEGFKNITITTDHV